MYKLLRLTRLFTTKMTDKLENTDRRERLLRYDTQMRVRDTQV